MPDLAGEKALVTGASRRLGRAIAERLAADGAEVALHYRSDKAGAEDTAKTIGRGSPILQADLADTDACERLVADADEALGGLTLLVNNAATFHKTPLDDLEVGDFDHFMRANARSVYVLSLTAGRLFKERGRGCIVNLADIAGLVPWPAFVPYSASKAAVVSLTKGFAKALAPEVRVNAVAPGPVLPPAGEPPEQGEKAVAQTLLKRWGSADDIAAAVAFLARTPYVTGQVLPVDGGRSVNA
jgi:NAD(P)-dependent dehydrogenase (short-subunit alcohol dehydrogenase family)